MKRLIVMLAVCAVGSALASLGCGGSSSAGPDAATQVTLQSLFPADNEVTGWAIDTTSSPNGVETYQTESAVEATPVDGDITPFQDAGFVGLGRVFYKNATYTLELRVWQMKDAAAATSVYSGVITETGSHYGPIQFTDTTIGGATGRYGFLNPQWYVDAYKGAYFVEARVHPSTISDTAGHDQAIPVVAAVIGKIP